MIKYLPKIFTVLFLTAILAACSSDDSTTNEPIEQNGGEAFQGQLVTLSLPDERLTNLEYQGHIDEVMITLIKSEEGKLVFVMPASLAPGTHELIVPLLALTVSYTVEATVLTGTSDETIAGFVANLNAFAAIVDDSPQGQIVKTNVDSFVAYFANASEAEKTEIAIAYKANKTLFDSVLSTSAGDRGIIGSTWDLLTEYKKEVVVVAAAAALIAGAPGFAVVGVAVVAAGAYNYYKTRTEIDEKILTSINVTVGGWFGSNDRGENSDELILEDGRLKTFTFNLAERKFIASDAGKTSPAAVTFFDAFEKYNYCANKVNPIIDNINDVKNTNYSSIQNDQVDATSPEISTPVTTELYENIDFSFDHPNVSLVSATVSAEGQLSLKVDITGNPSSLPFTADLKYAYSDGLSTFTGKLPVTIMPSVIGTWALQSFENGTAVGSYFNYAFAPDCSTLATASYTITSEVYTIGETTYSYSGSEITRQHNLTYSGCTVINDGADILDTYPYSGGGTYTLDGGTYVAVEGGETISLAFQWITPDKIKIDDKVYTRN
jgi:hypothetical protein